MLGLGLGLGASLLIADCGCTIPRDRGPVPDARYTSLVFNEYSSTRQYRKYFNTSCQWRRTGGESTYLAPEGSGPRTSV